MQRARNETPWHRHCLHSQGCCGSLQKHLLHRSLAMLRQNEALSAFGLLLLVAAMAVPQPTRKTLNKPPKPKPKPRKEFWAARRRLGHFTAVCWTQLKPPQHLNEASNSKLVFFRFPALVPEATTTEHIFGWSGLEVSPRPELSSFHSHVNNLIKLPPNTKPDSSAESLRALAGRRLRLWGALTSALPGPARPRRDARPAGERCGARPAGGARAGGTEPRPPSAAPCGGEGARGRATVGIWVTPNLPAGGRAGRQCWLRFLLAAVGLCHTVQGGGEPSTGRRFGQHMS